MIRVIVYSVNEHGEKERIYKDKYVHTDHEVRQYIQKWLGGMEHANIENIGQISDDDGMADSVLFSYKKMRVLVQREKTTEHPTEATTEQPAPTEEPTDPNQTPDLPKAGARTKQRTKKPRKRK